jgi:signal transduction histidine kinase/CheY-like chemotaxis protein
VKLKTILGINALVPIVLPLTTILLLRWRYWEILGPDPLNVSFLAALGLFGTAMSGVIVMCNRRILDRVARLNAWTDSLQAGNLESGLANQQCDDHDEVTRLAQAFERILGDIRNSYAALNREVIANKRRAEISEQRASASQIGIKHLTDAIARLKNLQAKTVNEERAKALEQVVKGVTHNFGEALTPIMATTDLLLARPDLADNREKLLSHIQSIRLSAERGKEVIRQLASFFRRIPVARSTVDINHILRAAIEQIDAMWQEPAGWVKNPITLRTDLRNVPSIVGNENDLRDAIVGLVTNAIEAMPNGGTVSIASRAEESTVIIEVSDTGAGMDEDVRQRAREPFFSTKGAQHRGMGLTQAEGTVRSHGGDFYVDSDPGRGTRVTLRFPTNHGHAGTAHTVGAPRQDPRPMDVVIVDDDKTTRDVITFVACANGHRAVAVANAEQCLALMRTTPFDLAIVDMIMPGMRGDELAATIARTHPPTAIIMLTGLGEIMMESGDVPEHVDVFLSKPLGAQDLLSAMDNARQAHWENMQKRQTASKTPEQATPWNRPGAAFTVNDLKWNG